MGVIHSESTGPSSRAALNALAALSARSRGVQRPYAIDLEVAGIVGPDRDLVQAAFLYEQPAPPTDAEDHLGDDALQIRQLVDTWHLDIGEKRLSLPVDVEQKELGAEPRLVAQQASPRHRQQKNCE